MMRTEQIVAKYRDGEEKVLFLWHGSVIRFVKYGPAPWAMFGFVAKGRPGKLPA